jgi:diguanylate cyclase (GGDEF)-like protein
MRSSLTCPLLARGQPIGFLFFSSMERGTYAEVHQDLFLRIAGQLSVILGKSLLYEELLDTTDRLREARDALEYQATHDSLTGLWNRRSVLELLERDLSRSERDGRPLSAVMIDIDHFKQINDEIGHLAGDRVLTEVARRVLATLRSSDTFGRIGGEEFLMILYPADETTALEVMERARLACSSEPVEIDSGSLEATVSLGAAVVNEAGRITLSRLLQTADRALYRAKNAGRNRSELDVI